MYINTYLCIYIYILNLCIYLCICVHYVRPAICRGEIASGHNHLHNGEYCSLQGHIPHQ